MLFAAPWNDPQNDSFRWPLCEPCCWVCQAGGEGAGGSARGHCESVVRRADIPAGQVRAAGVRFRQAPHQGSSPNAGLSCCSNHLWSALITRSISELLCRPCPCTWTVESSSASYCVLSSGRINLGAKTPGQQRTCTSDSNGCMFRQSDH